MGKNRNYSYDSKDKHYQKENFPKRIGSCTTQSSGLAIYKKTVFLSVISVRANKNWQKHVFKFFITEFDIRVMNSLGIASNIPTYPGIGNILCFLKGQMMPLF
ncbi:hypothetical protein BIZ36_04700 [Cytophaga sp. FL35]|nr:hypothetical protein [Cytophaga sp. FL35]